MNSRSAIRLTLAGLFLLLSPPPRALEEIDSGVFKIDFKSVDDLLGLPQQANVRVLILEDSQPRSVSDAHAKRVQQWVEEGGVLWVAGAGLKSAIAEMLVPFRVDRFRYVKSSTDKRGGELIVKGVTSRLVIHDHPLTEGIEQLYVFPHSRFDGTRNTQPLVSMTDTKGNTGLLMTAIPVGQGLVLLDGTARDRGRMFRRMPGMDAKYPNSLKQGNQWNSYDWAKIVLNAAAHARPE